VARRPPHSEPSHQFEAEHQVFEARAPDDGSPGRIIATMVGIVGILLLGSLFWSAVGALFGALGAASESFPLGRQPTPFVLSAQSTSAPVPTPRPTQIAVATPPAPTPAATIAPTAPTEPTARPEPTVPPPATNEPAGRAPWVLLPQPAPGSQVSAGQVTVEARGRGDAAIAEIRLELDGAALPTTLEQRSDSIWRGAASARLGVGQHSAKATVVDEHGRSGSFRWTFEASP
jgi:hypothetical protein